MRKFILKTGFFILPILLIALTLEFLLQSMPNDYKYKKKYLDMHSSEIETLILGNSHFFYGIDPVYFDTNCFNASHVSQSLDYDFEILKKYNKDLRNLKTVILPISYFSLFSKLESSPESWRIKNYAIYYGINPSNIFKNFIELFSNKLNINFKRLNSYYLNGETNISCSKLGWGTTANSKNQKNLFETGKTAAIRHAIKKEDYLNNNILVLNSIIELCNANNVKVILITPPAFHVYRENLSQKRLNIISKTVSEIVNYNKNSNYLNLLDDASFIASDFYDADHLNEKGTKKLSSLLNAYMKDKE